MKVILGVDAGNHQVKIVGQKGAFSFLSNICEYFERNVEENFGRDDMVWSYNGRKGFAGTLAEREDEFGGNMYGDSKAHEDAKIRVLLALHRYCNNNDEVYLVTGQPISKHNPSEKKKIKEMLLGKHVIEVNGETKTLDVKGVEVSPEGSAAFWSNPLPGEIKILDVGSGTVNAAAIHHKKHINSQSSTFNFGTETVNTKDYAAIARGIIRNTSKKWSRQDTVFVCGGSAELITPYLSNHYSKVNILRPLLKTSGKHLILHPVYANAIGFYELAKRVF